MGAKHDLKHSIHEILMRNKDGSFATQADRRSLLMRFAEELHSLGYGLRHIQGLKEKHIQAVVKHWHENQLTNATLKNRLSAIRYLATKINKITIIPSNQELKIGKRKYVPQFNRALIEPDFSKITDPYLHLSLQLQRVFGLRREEAIKIKPHLADNDRYLTLQPSWCKGGRGRNIPIFTEEQRYWLMKAKEFTNKTDSLIPPEKTYIQQRYVYDKQVLKAGLRNLHGLRHAYAQRRYLELTGWEAPINGGPTAKELTPQMRKLDHEARMILSEELGHSRRQIVKNYCG